MAHTIFPINKYTTKISLIKQVQSSSKTKMPKNYMMDDIESIRYIIKTVTVDLKQSSDFCGISTL